MHTDTQSTIRLCPATSRAAESPRHLAVAPTVLGRATHGVHTVVAEPQACTRDALSCRLDREWAQLCRRPAVLDRVREWNLTDIPFDSLEQLLGLCGLSPTRRTATPDADRVLTRLVALAATEPLAARIVLQRILPGLLAIVRREQARDRTADAFELLVGEAWLSIVSYRADTRPTDIAARLLNDARHRTFTAPRRRSERSREEIVTTAELDRPYAPAPTSAFDEVVGVLSDARRNGLGDDDVAAARSWLDGSSRDAGVTERTMRNRRARAVRRIRELAA